MEVGDAVPGPGLQHDFFIVVQENTHVALARRKALEAAKLANLSESDSGAVGIVVTEAATNLLKHAGGGEIIVRFCRDYPASLEILALDRGKGMSNPARCMVDGYSTAGSPGTGLGAIHRLSQYDDIYSVRDQGTVLLARIGQGSLPASTFMAGSICAPVPGEEISGDAWILQSSGDHCRLVVADGLGHGTGRCRSIPGCHAGRTREYVGVPTGILSTSLTPACALLAGAALAIAEIRLGESESRFFRGGKYIRIHRFGDEPRRQMVSMNGTAGHDIRTPQEFSYPWKPGSWLILHSDGLRSQWSLDRYSGLLQRHPSIIAAVLFRDFRRGGDDATGCVRRLMSDNSGV